MSFWRNFSKTALWISFVICTIGVLISSFVMIANEGFLFGLLYLLGGTLVDLMLHATFGMLVELCDNVAEIRGELGSVNKNTRYLNTEPDIPSSTTVSPSTHKSTSIAKLTAINNGEKYTVDYWTCADCNTKNDKLATICKGCGKYK